MWDYNARENSTYLQLLNGDDWKLNIFQNQSEAEKYLQQVRNGFMDADFDADAEGWNTVEVPRSWTTYWDADFTFDDFTIYTNVQMRGSQSMTPASACRRHRRTIIGRIIQKDIHCK